MIEEIEERIGHHFKNREYLYAALTHKSYNEGGKESRADNERLEFLGDSVIGLAVTDHLFRKLRGRSEGELAKIRAHLVSARCLCQIARGLDLGPALFLGRGEEKNKGRENKSILAAAFEALIGAVFLDAGFKAAAQIVIRLVSGFSEPLLQAQARINDYKSELQELVQRHRGALPVYRVQSESGRPPHTVFVVTVFLDDIEIGSGKGRSRREAEQEAAMQALRHIGRFIKFEKLSEVFFLGESSPED